jgi:hypothetical protein
MDRSAVIEEIQEAREKSQVAAAATLARKSSNEIAAELFPGKSLIALSDESIARLEAQGNTSGDWKKVKVVEDFNPQRVRNCRFEGECVLGVFTGEVEVAGAKLSCGIYSSTISDSIIASEALIRDVKLLSHYIVREKAVLFNCGLVATGGEVNFGNGNELPIAIETGGREVRIYAEITIPIAATVATSRSDAQFLKKYNQALDEYVQSVTAPRGVIERGARIFNTKKVVDSFVGECAHIDGAEMVENSTLLSAEGEETEVSGGAIVRSSLLQWGCEATTMAIVESSALTEHSHAERQGKVTESILGPNTGVGEGECTASLLGPFVGFHHQALVIAAFWPEGKGNVGHGANIGSNHTSKAPDQEIWPGEGTFFGMGVNVKFPSDFTKAPYSILATGVDLLPQRITFPFSLVNIPREVHPGMSPAFNEIAPGWVLSDNLFMLKRNEGKYKRRNKARRTQFEFDVFRPDTVALMQDARSRLQAAGGKEIYIEKDIPGLGKNFMLEASRIKAIKIYTFFLRYYALLGLKDAVEEALPSGRGEAMGNLLEKPSGNERWELQRKILASEFAGADIPSLLNRLIEMQGKVAQDVEASKEKDDLRGPRIIDDYAQAHTPASEDDFVSETREVTQKMTEEIRGLLKEMKT